VFRERREEGGFPGPWGERGISGERKKGEGCAKRKERGTPHRGLSRDGAR